MLPWFVMTAKTRKSYGPVLGRIVVGVLFGKWLVSVVRSAARCHRNRSVRWHRITRLAVLKLVRGSGYAWLK